MIRFARELTAVLMHRSSNVLITVALWLQRGAFRAEFGSDWKAQRDLHYSRGITGAHYRLNVDPSNGSH